MGNLDLWERFADIDPQFTKPITGKPYKGTSPNPHYIIKCLTEMFGPVGVGFGWEVTAEGFEPLGDEVLHWCRIRFWHGAGKGFDSYGQTKAVTIAKRGTPQQYAMVDEDAPKKSLTDAITKAAAQVGVAANIFLGRWDDSRYVDQVNAEYRREEREEREAAAPPPPPLDAIAARDRIVKALAEAQTAEDLARILETERLDLTRLKEADPPKRLECDAAYRTAAARIKAAQQEKAA
jgi:hypothetical protein